MMKFSLRNIAPVLSAALIGTDQTIQTVNTDSRTTINEQCLFVALKGNNFDAHAFANRVIAAGARALLVSKRLQLDAPQLIVTDTRRALGQLGAWWRQQVKAKVIALTGSSGKTTVKEMTAAILRQCGRVLATQKNFNNDIGVSLTLLRLTPQDDFAVIELGANHHGEIAWTTSLVCPETVLVNNISAAHLSGFGSILGIAQAKGEIFAGIPDYGRAIINDDSHDWINWQRILNNKKVWRFALQAAEGVDFFASNIVKDQKGMHFKLHSPQGSCLVYLPLLGQHNITNALAASALALSVGAPLSAISNGLEQLEAIPGRLCPIIIGSNQLILDDSYNANVGSMNAAIQVLAEMVGYRVMVVGDMAELGHEEAEYHRQVGRMIAIAGIDKVLSVGHLGYLISATSGRGEYFQDKASLISRLMQLLSEHTVITVLVKGSRNIMMEQIVGALKEKLFC